MVSFGVCSIIPIATTLEQVSALQPNEMELNQYSTSQVAEVSETATAADVTLAVS
jgi:hypothetical protein